MSKITFRADDELVARLEELDVSKSEVMREALREFLDREASEDRPRAEADSAAPSDESDTVAEATTLDDALTARVDDLLEKRVDTLLERRLDTLLERRLRNRREPVRPAQDINLSINLDGARVTGTSDGRSVVTREDDADAAETVTDAGREQGGESTADESGCGQCGESLSDDHVYCPNCGEKRAHRVFCECGDEVRSDWGFCPSCGRRTPAADVLDRT